MKCVCVTLLISVKLTDMRTSTLIPKSCDFYFASSPHWKELGSLWNCLDNLCTPLPCRQNNEYIFNGNLSEYITRHRRVIKSGAWPLTTRNSYPILPLYHGLICRSCLTPRLFITELPRALWQWNTSTLIYWVRKIRQWACHNCSSNLPSQATSTQASLLRNKNWVLLYTMHY